MNKMLSFSTRNSWFWILIVVVSTGYFAAYIPDIKIDTTTKRFMSEDDPDRVVYEHAKNIFGTDDVLTIVFDDPELYTPEKLQLIKDKIVEFQLLPEVKKVDSLFNTSNFYTNEDNILETTAIFDIIPDSVDEIRKRIGIALDNPLFYRTLISPERPSLTIHLYGDEKEAQRDDFYDEFYAKTQEIIAPIKDQFADLYMVGSPVVNTVLKETILSDVGKTFPLSVVIISFIFFLIFGSLNSSVVPLITGILSLIWAMGTTVMLDIPVQFLFTAIPVILIVIGSTEDTHIIAAYFDGINEGESRQEAIESMSRRLSIPIILTSLTTAIGFSTIVLNEIIMLKEFGIVTSLSIIYNFFLTIVIVPLYLKYFGEKQKINKKSSNFSNIIVQWCIKASVNIYKYYRTHTIIIVTLIFAASFYAMKELNADDSPLGHLKESSPVRQNIQKIADYFSGNDTFFITLESPDDTPIDFRHAKNLKVIREIEQIVEDQGNFDAARSLASLVSLIHRELDPDGEFGDDLPNNDALINQYMLFLSHDDKVKYVTSDYSLANVVVWYQPKSSAALVKVMNELKIQLEQLSEETGIKITVTGWRLMVANAAHRILHSQVQSLALVIFSVFIIIAILFLDIKIALLSLIPNTLPIVIFFAIMSLTNTPLDFVTCNIATIAISIAVDDTIHFFAKYNQCMKKYHNQSRALQETLNLEMKPILSTTVALVAGMLALAFSDFVTIINFGVYTAGVLVLAIIADLVLTPLLLMTIGIRSTDTLFDRITVRVSHRLRLECLAFKSLSAHEIKRILLRGRVTDLNITSTPLELNPEQYTIILEGHVKIAKKSMRSQDSLSKDQFIDIAELGPTSVIPPLHSEHYLKSLTPVKVFHLTPAYLEELSYTDRKIKEKLMTNLKLIKERGL